MSHQHVIGLHYWAGVSLATGKETDISFSKESGKGYVQFLLGLLNIENCLQKPAEASES